MKTFNRMNSQQAQQGFSLFEIVVAMGIFAIGALALAGLQTSITQSAGNAKSRTTAVNIAQAEIEKFRGFLSVGANANGDPSFADIVSTDSPVTSTVGGTVYSLTRAVTPYYRVANAFTDAVPIPAPANSDFKKLVVTVAWTDPDESVQTTTLTDVIGSISTAGSGRAIAGGGRQLTPPVPYIPGQRPDVAAIDLGELRFKETLTPEPEVFSDNADGQFVMTGFDVITFSQDPDNQESRFLRREENRVLNCECTLNAADAAIETSQPMIWTGEEYVEGNLISKPYGTPAPGRTQDPLCDVCCRDHNDSDAPDTSGVEASYLPDPARFKYDPWNADSVHSHYAKNDLGDLVVASTGDNYFEACRLIRSDGFFRVVQDVNVTNLVSVPEYYLKTEADIVNYSDYVTEIVSDFMDAVTPSYPGATPSVDDLIIAADPLPPASTSLPEPLNIDPTATSQQLRSRAIYMDYLTKQTRLLYECLTDVFEDADDDTTSADCNAPQISSALEIVPFFELNMTHLAEWGSQKINEVAITNEPLPSISGVAYSRGVAEKVSNNADTVGVTSKLSPSNTGLTNTDPISPADTGTGRIANIDVAVFGSETPPVNVIKVSGTISTQGGTGVDATDIVILLDSSEGGNCQSDGTVYSCTFIADASGLGTGYIVVSNYNNIGQNKNNAACDVSTSVVGDVANDDNESETTSFFYSGLPTGITTMNILIKKNNSC